MRHFTTIRRPAAVRLRLAAGLSIVMLMLAACGSAGDRADDQNSLSPTRSADSPGATADGDLAAGRPSPSPTEPPELPRGGRQIFPAHRVVAHYGTPDTGVLGILGEGGPDAAAVRLEKAAAAFVTPGGKPVLPAFELIVTVADAYAGSDGGYSHPISDRAIARYIQAARQAKALVVLDVQPGRADLIDEVKRYEKWLVQPDVGLAIDPEWTMARDEVPGRVIGGVNAGTVNAVSDYLAGLVVQHDLPQKLFVVHQFRASMVTNRAAVVPRPGLATVFHIDGFGTPGQKLEVYSALKAPTGFFNGFKLFIDEDKPTLSPAQAMAISPRPDLISYQ